jgi:hypothetical protein
MCKAVADVTENVASAAVTAYFPKMSLEGTFSTAPGRRSPA